jgi:hypothetical protein
MQSFAKPSALGLLQSSLAEAFEELCHRSRRVRDVALDPSNRIIRMQFFRSERRVAPAGDAGWPRMRRALQRAIASAVVKGPVDFRWALQRAHGAGIPCWSRYCRQILAYALRVSHFSALNDRFEAGLGHAQFAGLDAIHIIVPSFVTITHRA